MDTYRENFIQRLQRLQTEVKDTDTPVGYENMIDEAVRTIRHFSMSNASAPVEKEKQKTMESLLGVKKSIAAGVLHAKKSADEEYNEQLKIAGDIVNILQNFTRYITELQIK